MHAANRDPRQHLTGPAAAVALPLQAKNAAVESVAGGEAIVNRRNRADGTPSADVGHGRAGVDHNVVGGAGVIPARDEVEPVVAIAAEEKAAIDVVAEDGRLGQHVDVAVS